MAAASISQNSITGLVSKLVFQNSSHLILHNPFSKILSAPSSSWALKKVNHGLRLQVSSDSEGLNSASELTVEDSDSDSKFVPLNPEDPKYGPPALLLLGFQAQEADNIQKLLKELEGEFLKVIFCTEEMITGSLWDAVNTAHQSLEKIKIAKSVARICFLSGLTGEEMMMFIDAFQETGMEPAVFAALVPNSAHKSLLELMEEIMADYEMTTAKQLHSQDV